MYGAMCFRRRHLRTYPATPRRGVDGNADASILFRDGYHWAAVRGSGMLDEVGGQVYTGRGQHPPLLGVERVDQAVR